MKSEVFYKLQLSWPGNLDSGFERCCNAPDRVELTDRLGYCYDWEVEPHIFDKYPHTSASDVVGAGAQRDICKSLELSVCEVMSHLRGNIPSHEVRMAGPLPGEIEPEEYENRGFQGAVWREGADHPACMSRLARRSDV